MSIINSSSARRRCITQCIKVHREGVYFHSPWKLREPHVSEWREDSLYHHCMSVPAPEPQYQWEQLHIHNPAFLASRRTVFYFVSPRLCGRSKVSHALCCGTSASQGAQARLIVLQRSLTRRLRNTAPWVWKSECSLIKGPCVIRQTGRGKKKFILKDKAWAGKRQPRHLGCLK